MYVAYSNRQLPRSVLHLCKCPCQTRVQPRQRPASCTPAGARQHTLAAPQPPTASDLGCNAQSGGHFRSLAAAASTAEPQGASYSRAEQHPPSALALALATAAFQARQDAIAAVTCAPGPAAAKQAADAIRAHPAMAHLPPAWVELVANWEAAGILTPLATKQAYSAAGYQEGMEPEQLQVLSAASLLLMGLVSSSELSQLGDWQLVLEELHSSKQPAAPTGAPAAAGGATSVAPAAQGTGGGPAAAGDTTSAAADLYNMPVPLAVQQLVEGIPPAGSSCSLDSAQVTASLRSLIALLKTWVNPTTLGCRAVASHLVNLAVKREWHSGDLEAFLQALPKHVVVRLFASVAALWPPQQGEPHGWAAGNPTGGQTRSNSSTDAGTAKSTSSCSSHPLWDVGELEEDDELLEEGIKGAAAAAMGRTGVELQPGTAVKPVFDPREVTLQAAYEAGSVGELPGVAVADLLQLLPPPAAGATSAGAAAAASSKGAARPAVGGEHAGYAVTLEAAYEAGSMGELPGVAVAHLMASLARAPPGDLNGQRRPHGEAAVGSTAGKSADVAAAGGGVRVGLGQGGVALGAAYEAGSMGELPAAALCM